MASPLPPRVCCAGSAVAASGGYNLKFLHHRDLFFYKRVLIHLFYIKINACMREGNGASPFSISSSWNLESSSSFPMSGRTRSTVNAQSDYTCKNNLDKPESLPRYYDTALFTYILKFLLVSQTKPHVNICCCIADYKTINCLCVRWPRHLLWCNRSYFQGFHIPHYRWSLREGTCWCYQKDHSCQNETVNKAILPGREPPLEPSWVSTQLGHTPHLSSAEMGSAGNWSCISGQE